jgi:hypothetical protein
MKFRHKGSGDIVRAAQWSGGNSAEVAAIADHKNPWVHMTLHMSEHEAIDLGPGDWLVKDAGRSLMGSPYVVWSDEQFQTRYERVEE